MPTGYAYAAGFTVVGTIAIAFGFFTEAAILYILSIILTAITLYAFKKGY